MTDIKIGGRTPAQWRDDPRSHRYGDVVFQEAIDLIESLAGERDEYRFLFDSICKHALPGVEDSTEIVIKRLKERDSFKAESASVQQANWKLSDALTKAGDQNHALKAEVERLKSFPCCGGNDETPALHTQDCPTFDITTLRVDLATKTVQLATAVKALEFYSNKDNLNCVDTNYAGVGNPGPYYQDQGDKAREALQKLKGKT